MTNNKVNYGKLWCNKVVSKFFEKLYTGVIRVEDIPERKISVKMKTENGTDQLWGWEIPYGTQKLFLTDKIDVTINGVTETKETLELLPIKIKATVEFDYQKEVYLRAMSVATFNIKPAKLLSVKKMVDLSSNLKHTYPEDYKLMVMLGFASYFLPMNWRISSCAGFGKNCFFDNLKRLSQEVQCFQPKSAPKLKKECHGRSLVVANEFMELPLGNKKELEDFFRYVGDNNPELENSSLASSAFGTLDKYDTDNLSVGVIYNLVDYYIKPNRKESRENEFFDFMYTKATNDRYFPMLFDKGELDARQFRVHKSKLQEEYDKYEKYYLAVLKSMMYWQSNFDESLKGKESWELNQDHVIKTSRLDKHYRNLLEFIKAYSESEQEYNKWADKVWHKYINYLESINWNRIQEVKNAIQVESLGDENE